MQRELMPAEVSDLLNRNFDLQAKVLSHTRIVQSGQWDQVRMNESVFPNLPIPTKGRALNDDKFGVVVVFPDAKGTLHFSSNVAPEILNSDINKPPYESPSGNTLAQLVADLFTGLQNIGAGVALVGVLYLAVKGTS